MIHKLATLGLLTAAALFAVQTSPAMADDFHRGHGGGWGGGHGGYHGDYGHHRGNGGLLFGLGALTLGAVALATAPVRIVGEAFEAPPPPRPIYYQQPVYAQPYYAQPVYAQPVYGGYPPGYYHRYYHRPVVYAYPDYD